MDERALARGIGWASLAMGLALLAPARASRLFGLGARPALLRAIGARDLVVGLGLLRCGDRARWLRLQALADVADAALMGAGLLTGAFARGAGDPLAGRGAGVRPLQPGPGPAAGSTGGRGAMIPQWWISPVGQRDDVRAVPL